MVNTGHPSRACKLCRARRIKCDETRPHCLKCKKAKKQCPGYRDPFEINLRDETQSTIRKAKAAAATQNRAARQEQRGAAAGGSPYQSDRSLNAGRRKRRDSPQSSDSSSDSQSITGLSPSSDLAVLSGGSTSSACIPTPTAWDFQVVPTAQDSYFDFNDVWSLPETNLSSPIRRVAKSISSSFDGTRLGFNTELRGLEPSSMTTPPVLPGLQTPLDEQATCFFLSNFVLSVSAGQNQCLFNFILKILERHDIKDTPFPMAFTAVSLAALAGRPNSRHLISKSRIYYSTALIQLKDVIKDKDEAKRDTSLATAILLSFYEVSQTTTLPR